MIKNLEERLIAQQYVKSAGVFTRNPQGVVADITEAERVWSKLAQTNPIHAAAATDSTDPYVKYPEIIRAEISDEPCLALDAGCGYGRIAIPLLKANPRLELVGVDASPVMLRNFLRLLNAESPEIEIDRRVCLLHSNIHTLPFPEATFDDVYSCAVLLHNPYQDVQAMIREFCRVLKPGGKLILQGSFPNVLNPEGVQNLLYLCFVDERTANGPVRVYTKSRVARLFQGWSQMTILPTGATVLPRQIAILRLPFGDGIRKLNRWVEQQQFAWLARTSLFIKYFDVIAIKKHVHPYMESVTL